MIGGTERAENRGAISFNRVEKGSKLIHYAPYLYYYRKLSQKKSMEGA
jgi:hypothetical protein